MIISKMGSEHFLYNINNQDNAFIRAGLKVVCDGCSEGKASEVGVKLFDLLFSPFRISQLTTKAYYLSEVFEDRLLTIIPNDAIIDYLLFTILIVDPDNKDSFVVEYCGDGYVLLIDHNDKMTIKELEFGQVNGNPIYYAYNFIPEDRLIGIKHDQCGINRLEFPKSEYKNVGVASDGLRYIFGTEFEQEFRDLIVKGNEIGIKRLINKHQNSFHDDISIAL